MRFLTSIFFFVTVFTLNAQSPGFKWAKGMGANGGDNGNAIAVDLSGNVYTTGTFSNSVDFDPGPGTYSLTTVGNLDIFVTKFDASGNFLWARDIGGLNYEYSLSMALDASGNIYITGHYQGTTDFDPGPGVYNLTSAAGTDIFIFKLDPSGNFVWAKSLGGTGYDYGESITIDAFGDIYTSGYFSGTGDFDPGPGTYNLVSNPVYDAFISKLDASGNFIWAKSIGGTSVDNIFSVKTDPSGNVYCGGYFNSAAADFDPGPASYTLAPVGDYDAFILKLNSAGSFIWAKNFGGTGDDKLLSIAVNASGDVYSTGHYKVTADFDPGPAIYNLSPVVLHQADIFVCKLDASGNFVWADRLGGPNWDQPTYITLDVMGNVYTTGAYSGPADFDPGPAVYNLSGSPASDDAFISKLDPAGNFIWAASTNGTNYEWSNCITIDAFNNIYLTGEYGFTADFDPGPSTFNMTPYFNGDVFVLKFCQGLTPTVTANGPTTFCQGGNVTFSVSSANGYLWSNGATTQNINVSTSGNVWVTVTDANSCGVGSTATLVTVNPIPTITVNSGSICSGNSFSIIANGANTYTYSGGSSIVGPTVSTSYSVTGTSSAGCVSASSAICNVTVNALPLPVISVNSGSICSGNSFTITPLGANTYTFLNGSSIVSPTTTTSYSIIGTATNGCVSSNTAISNVTVSALPLPTITVNSGSICSGNSFTINPGGASTYTISGGNAIVSPLSNTNYTVAGTNSNGCKSILSAVSHVTVNPLPVITAASGSVCSGKNFTITPGGAVTYTFSSGTSIVSPTTTSNYSVMGTNAFGCISASPAIVNVIVYQPPVISVNSSSVCIGYSAILSPSGAVSYTFSSGTNVVSPTVTTSYSVTGASVNGCISNVAIANVVVMPLPVISVNSGSVCMGQSFTLTPGGADVYYISNGNNTVVTPFTTTTYSVTGNTTLGCNSTSPAIATVVVNPLPTITGTSSSSIACIGQTVTLTASGGSTYTWNPGNIISTSISISPSVTVYYTVTGIDINGCQNSVNVPQFVTFCTDAPEESMSMNEIRVFPNPNNGNFNIQLNYPSRIIIYNALGQIIYDQKQINLMSHISISDYCNGIYLIQIVEKEKTIYSGRIIKN